MLGLGIGVLLLLGLVLLGLPYFRRMNQHRLQARLDFLTTRLRGQVDQLAKTTASKFPTDYQRLQQQIALDRTELAGLLKRQSHRLGQDKLAPAWGLLEEAGLLLPDQPDLEGTDHDGGQSQASSVQVKHLAPEVWEVVQNIQMDDRMIRQKIEEDDLPNRQELLAVHEANMGRFQDILDAYLTIKAHPKDYYQAEERLAQSRQALQTFDEQLDETLRQINEGQMMDFEVSLRMVNQDKA